MSMSIAIILVDEDLAYNQNLLNYSASGTQIELHSWWQGVDNEAMEFSLSFLAGSWSYLFELLKNTPAPYLVPVHCCCL